MKPYVIAVLKALVISYIISAASLLVLSAMLYWLDIGNAQIRLCIVITYVLSTLAGGFYVGKKVKKREFLWGLIVGLFYYAIHIAAVVALEGMQPEKIVPGTALALLCMGSGMMGGMLG